MFFTLSNSLLVLHFKYEILMFSKESLSTGLWTHRVTFPSLAAKYSTKTFTRGLSEPQMMIPGRSTRRVAANVRDPSRLSLYYFLITARGWPPSFRVSELSFPLRNSEYPANAHVKLPEGSEVLQWCNYGRHSRQNLL
jgi:hypothetical protein